MLLLTGSFTYDGLFLIQLGAIKHALQQQLSHLILAFLDTEKMQVLQSTGLSYFLHSLQNLESLQNLRSEQSSSRKLHKEF